ncbi:hypothetical protein EHQ13_10845 [Leptospira gomenensis]|uniref:Lipoprotein n=1 Tax=Leptospira gomenensis TaxID=2484974 RepID=A0A5F1YRM3_9LEPT|nr:hypothetical protein [Leptospira gomenensis]TGK39385.1 hypothetical protein EHQ17_00010 [Leptospira gomenensis]TGK41720.1 hypothetical protein EHQ07_15725 [Leptospira gomenensis]TGK60676.1 hypothetical protein EHQ13_10845 [Leptospira gomenensis]
MKIIKAIVTCFILFFSVFCLSNPEKLTSKEQEGDKVSNKIETGQLDNNVKQFSKQEKIRLFDAMLFDLTSKFQKTKDLSPFVEISFENSGLEFDQYRAKALSMNPVELRKYISYKEVLHLIKFGLKIIPVQGSSVQYRLAKDDFGYQLSFLFKEEQGKWLFYDLTKLSPSEKLFNIMLKRVIRDIQKKKSLAPLKDLSDESGYFYENNFEGNIQRDFEKLEKMVTYKDILKILILGKKKLLDEENESEMEIRHLEYRINFIFNEEDRIWKISIISQGERH